MNTISLYDQVGMPSDSASVSLSRMATMQRPAGERISARKASVATTATASTR